MILVTEVDCVYCAIRTDSFNIFQVHLTPSTAKECLGHLATEWK